jgi:hypothetical protein
MMSTNSRICQERTALGGDALELADTRAGGEMFEEMKLTGC